VFILFKPLAVVFNRIAGLLNIRNEIRMVFSQAVGQSLVAASFVIYIMESYEGQIAGCFG